MQLLPDRNQNDVITIAHPIPCELRLDDNLWRPSVCFDIPGHGPLARYEKLRVANVPGMPGSLSPPPRVSHPGMHYGTCVTHVPWCMPGSLTIAVSFEISDGENVPGIPRACATRNFTYLARGPLFFFFLNYMIRHWWIDMAFFYQYSSGLRPFPRSTAEVVSPCLIWCLSVGLCCRQWLHCETPCTIVTRYFTNLARCLSTQSLCQQNTSCLINSIYVYRV